MGAIYNAFLVWETSGTNYLFFFALEASGTNFGCYLQYSLAFQGFATRRLHSASLETNFQISISIGTGLLTVSGPPEFQKTVFK